MTLTLEIPDEVQRDLVREARIRGVSPSSLAIGLLRDAVSRPSSVQTVYGGRSLNEVRLWIDSLGEFSSDIPSMPGETFPREMIYSDRD